MHKINVYLIINFRQLDYFLITDQKDTWGVENIVTIGFYYSPYCIECNVLNQLTSQLQQKS